MKHMLFAGMAFSAATLFAAYEGPKMDIRLWKGESAIVRIEEKISGELEKLERHPQIVCTPMSARPVSYRIAPHNEHIASVCDLVESGSKMCAGYVRLLKVAADAGIAAGRYDLGPVRVTVVDRVLPPACEWKNFLDLWQHPWAVARYYDVKPFSRAHYRRMEKVYRTLADSGVKALTVTLLDQPWNHQCYDAYHSMIGRVRMDDGSWKFDYKVFDEYVEFGRKCGIGPDIACYTMCPWGYVVRWRNERGEIERAVAKPGSREFEDFWGAFLLDFTAHLKAKGWFEDTYIAMDERSPEDVSFIAKFIQERSPGMKIAMAGNRKPSDFKGITIDNYSQIVYDITPEFLAEVPGRRENGFKTTFYVCCAPHRPNSFMTSGKNEPFWLGVYSALCGLDGFLRWAANSWPQDPYADAAFGNWAPGDTFLVYPDGEPSLRLVDLRAGVITAEKLRILNENGAIAAELKAFAEKFHYRKASADGFDFQRCRRELENFVNR
jgi:hypothetical protein